MKTLKKSLLLIPLFFWINFQTAYSQFSLVLQTPTDQLLCPESSIRYEVQFHPNYKGCLYDWTIVEGTGYFVGNNTSYYARVFWHDGYPNTVKVKLTIRYFFDDPDQPGKSCRNNGVTEERIITHTLQSLFNETIARGTPSVSIPYCTTNPTTLRVERIQIRNTGGIGEPPATYATSFRWNLPYGFKRVGTDQTGEFETPENEIVVYPIDNCIKATASVKAVTTCTNLIPSISKPYTITISRTPTFQISPPTGYTGSKCGVIDPVVFTTTTYTCAGGYNWSFPAGWSGATFTTSNTNTLTPSGSTADAGAITVSVNVGPCPNLVASYNVGFQTPFIWIDGPDPLCSTSIYTLNGLSSNAVVNWSTNPTVNISPTAGNGFSAQLSKISNGNTTLTFSIPSCAASVSKSIKVGPYSSSDYPIQGPDYANCNDYVYYSIPDLPGATSINWSWPSAWTYVSGQGTRYLALRATSYGSTVAVGVNNPCGISGSYATKYTYVSGCGYRFNASPNPADAELTITYNETTEEKEAASYRETFSTDIQVALIDLKQVKRHVEKTSKKKFSIPTKHLEKGIYILHIVTSEGEEKQQIEINH